MSKKLIALVEVLMVVSLFCTGFASWSIVIDIQDDAYLTFTSEAYDVEAHVLEEYGIALTSEADGLKATSFGYVETLVAGGEIVYQPTNSTLSMLLSVDTATMAANENDYREQTLLLTCTAREIELDKNGNPTGNKPQRTFKSANGVTTHYNAPKFCKLTLNDYPNRYIMVDLSNNFDSSGRINVDVLTIEIPLVQLYNLAKDYMVKDSNGNLKTPIVIAELEFEPGTTGRVDIPANWIYTFAAKIK